MAAKRIRCVCGKIYDAGSLAHCPDCQTASPFFATAEESVSPEASSKTNLPPPLPQDEAIMLDSDRKKRPWLYFRAEHPYLAFLLDHKKIVGTVVLFALLGVGFVIRHRPKPTPDTTAQAIPPMGSLTVADKEKPTTSPTPPPPAEVLKITSSQDLAAEIAKAKPGSTIQLAAGTYRSGFIIDRPLHLIGDSTGGPVIIESNNLGSLQINAADVILENLRFTGQPGGNFALLKVLDKAVLDLRQCVFDTAGKFGVGAVATGKFSADRCTFSTASSGTGIQLENDSRSELTDCLLKNNRWGCTIRESAQCKVVRCHFEQNGLPNQSGYSLGGTGAKTYALVEQCTFTANPRGVIANEGSHIILKGCVFKNNGVDDEPGHTTFGTVNANGGGQLLINDGTFDANKQGVIVQTGGSVKMENCNLTNNGLRTAPTLAFYASTISAENEGSKVSLFKTNIRQAQQSGLNIVTGASVEMEDCEVSGALRHGLGIGAGDQLHGEATVVNCRFLNNKFDGVNIAPDSLVKISRSSLSRNGRNGIHVTGNNAAVSAEDCDLSSNASCGIFARESAFAVISGSTLAANLYGAQTGEAKVKKGAILALKSCKITDSKSFGAGAFGEGTLDLIDTSFARNKKDHYKGGGLILETWTGPKDEIDKKNGLGPTGKTGGMTGLESTPATPASDDGEPKTEVTDSDDQKVSTNPQRRPPTKKKPTQPSRPSRPEEIIDKIRRHLPF
jgi:hypothetical protein